MCPLLLPAMPDLFVVFVIGLLGSAHCVGMCGGFVLALSQTYERSRHSQTHQLHYFSGKTLYAAGAAAAALGAAFSGLQNAISVALGLVLIVLGLSLVGVLQRFEGWSRWSVVHRFTRTLGDLRRRSRHTHPARRAARGYAGCAPALTIPERLCCVCEGAAPIHRQGTLTDRVSRITPTEKALHVTRTSAGFVASGDEGR